MERQVLTLAPKFCAFEARNSGCRGWAPWDLGRSLPTLVTKGIPRIGNEHSLASSSLPSLCQLSLPGPVPQAPHGCAGPQHPTPTSPALPSGPPLTSPGSIKSIIRQYQQPPRGGQPGARRSALPRPQPSSPPALQRGTSSPTLSTCPPRAHPLGQQRPAQQPLGSESHNAGGPDEPREQKEAHAAL